MKNYYRILEVEPTASFDQIKAKYRLLIHAWHPDKFPTGELRAKAEEKTKDLNEAFDILRDPKNRENFDHIFNSAGTKPSSHKQPNVQPPNDSADTRVTEYCSTCGVLAETKYVQFYQTIGMIVLRQRRLIEGKMCKACIEYFFWNFTGITMLFGWWGIISFITTPFVLLNNFFRYFAALGIKHPPHRIVPQPSVFWVLSTIGGVIGFGVICLSIFSTYTAGLEHVQPRASVSTPTRYPTKPAGAPVTAVTPTTFKETNLIPRPKFASETEIETLLSSGALKTIYDFVDAPRRNDDDITYGINLPTDTQPIFVPGGWCSKTAEQLNDNWHLLHLSLVVNDFTVPAYETYTFDSDEEIDVAGIGKQSAKCRTVYIVLKDWPKGYHVLNVVIEFENDINDGWDWYYKGDIQNVTFNVFVVDSTSTNLQPSSTVPSYATGSVEIPEVNCFKPGQIKYAMLGDEVCVFGRLIELPDHSYTIEDQDSNRLPLANTWNPSWWSASEEMKQSACVLIKGRVSVYTAGGLFLRVREWRTCD